MNYLVTYDLNKGGQNYDGLIGAIETYTHKHVMQSVWFIKTNLSAGKISEHLQGYIDGNDNLFICEITSNRGGWLPQTAWDFLK